MRNCWTLILAIGCGNRTKAVIIEPEAAETTVDADGDGYLSTEDCDDLDANINPDSIEICDGIDNNCNDSIDEGVENVYYQDLDADGFGDANFSTAAGKVAEKSIVCRSGRTCLMIALT